MPRKLTGEPARPPALYDPLAPAASVTRTMKLLVPPSVSPGVPDKIPVAATVSHAGPDALLYVSVSPGFGSVASPASVSL